MKCTRRGETGRTLGDASETVISKEAWGTLGTISREAVGSLWRISREAAVVSREIVSGETGAALERISSVTEGEKEH